MYLDIKHPNAPAEYPLTKTDSLAAFLMYENDSSLSPGEEERPEAIDKGIEINSDDDDKVNSISTVIASDTDQSNKSQNANGTQPDILPSPKYQSQSIKLAPIIRSNPTDSLLSNDEPQRKLDDIASYFIDPKLINANDNLKMIVSRQLSDIASNDSNESNETTKIATNKTINEKTMPSDFESMVQQCSSLQRINSGSSTISDLTGVEKRSLKRQMKLNKDNFLYDNNSSEQTTVRDDHDGRPLGRVPLPTLPPLQLNEPSSNGGSKSNRSTANIESLFDDFDIEEFISSFEDDDQYPIFKNYKELISNNRSGIIKQYGSDGSSDSESTYEEKSMDIAGKNDPNVDGIDRNSVSRKSSVDPNTHRSIYTNGDDMLDKNSCKRTTSSARDAIKRVPSNEKGVTHEYGIARKITLPMGDASMSQAELELLNSVHELNQMCESNSGFMIEPNDENYSFARSVSSKHSADSAYSR